MGITTGTGRRSRNCRRQLRASATGRRHKDHLHTYLEQVLYRLATRFHYRIPPELPAPIEVRRNLEKTDFPLN